MPTAATSPVGHLGPGAGPAMARVAVVGAGIAGLSAALTLQDGGCDVALFEASPQVGGKIGSDVCETPAGAFLLERGPNSFLGSARALWPLVARLGLADRLTPARGRGARWVYRGGRLRQLPSGPLSAVFGDWLPWHAKLRLFGELFVAARRDERETLHEFGARRCGENFADGVIGPFTSGVYAGDPRQLGAADAFPRMWRLEAEHGGLIRGALTRMVSPQVRKALRDERGGLPARPGLWNFDRGLKVLPDAIARALGPRVHLSLAIAALRRDGPLWRLEPASTATPDASASAALAQAFDAVVLALPPAATAALLAPLDGAAAQALQATPLAAVAIVHLGGDDPDAACPDGFGALVARGEGVDALGVLLPSAIFAGRAPPGSALAAVFLGGVHDPTVASRGDGDLIDRAIAGRSAVFGPALHRPPMLASVTRWQAAIPQYLPGHRGRVAAARADLVRSCPGVELAGAGCDGVSLDDAAASGVAVARRLLAAWGER